MLNIVEPINSRRVEEIDKLFVQFFDKKKQITNEDLETVDLVDENNQPIYELYVEIYNKEDPYSVLCKKVQGNNIAIRNNQGVIKRFEYTEFYKKAYQVYLQRKNQKIAENESQNEIQRLRAENEKLKKQNNLKNKNIVENNQNLE